MKLACKHASMVALVSLLTITSLSTHAQTLAKNTDWLEKQLNKLVIEDGKEKKSAPKFDFQSCQLNMKVDDGDKEASMAMNITWRLTDIRKVSYKQEKNGQYTLVLDGPADNVNVDLGGLSVSLGSNEKGRKSAKEPKNNANSFTLSTKDEALVKQIKERFDESIQLCQRNKN